MSFLPKISSWQQKDLPKRLPGRKDHVKESATSATLSLSVIQVDLPYVSMTRATFQNRTSLSFNSMFSAKLMPWYTFLIVFRVLSISLVIVGLPTTIWIPIYALLLLGIIFIGYWKTKRDWDFITRGLKSAFTSGLDRMDFNTY